MPPVCRFGSTSRTWSPTAIAKFAALTIAQLYLVTGLAAIVIAGRQRQA
jgi:hypothetical protein